MRISDRSSDLSSSDFVEDRLQTSLCGPVALAALKHDDSRCCASGQRELSRRCNHPVLDTATQRTAAERKKIHLADSASNLSQHLTDDSVVAETIACANRIVKPLARTRDEIGRASCRERVWQ